MVSNPAYITSFGDEFGYEFGDEFGDIAQEVKEWPTVAVLGWSRYRLFMTLHCYRNIS